jgi:hypothetical protein
MILAFDGSSVDGSAYRYVTGLAAHSPAWLDGWCPSGRRTGSGCSPS